MPEGKRTIFGLITLAASFIAAQAHITTALGVLAASARTDIAQIDVTPRSKLPQDDWRFGDLGGWNPNDPDENVQWQVPNEQQPAEATILAPMRRTPGKLLDKP